MQRTNCSTWPPFLKASLARAWSWLEPGSGNTLVHGLEAVRQVGSLALVWLGLAWPAAAQVVTISDSEFAPSDWSTTLIKTMGNGGSGTPGQVSSGGNPGAYRRMDQSLANAPAGEESHVGFFHAYLPETLDPSAVCGIASVSVFLDATQVAGFFGQGQGVQWGIRQNGTVYHGGYFIVPEHAWTSHALFDLSAGDFYATFDDTSHPDFSPTGTPIEVGFVTSNTTGGGIGYSTHVGYDNFRFELTLGLGPTSYCTAGTSASGCQAAIGSTGTPSASAPSGFFLTASTVEGQKDGLFFFGTSGRQANPWGNGTSYQCVLPPVKRTPVLGGLGTLGGCDGVFSYDLNAHWTSKPAHNPGAGSTVQAQLWYRDPGSTSNQPTSFSDALEFQVCQ